MLHMYYREGYVLFNPRAKRSFPTLEGFLYEINPMYVENVQRL